MTHASNQPILRRSRASALIVVTFGISISAAITVAPASETAVLHTFCGTVRTNDGIFATASPGHPRGTPGSLIRTAATTVNLFDPDGEPGQHWLTLTLRLGDAAACNLQIGTYHCVALAVTDDRLVAAHVLAARSPAAFVTSRVTAAYGCVRAAI
jgi:hypothetical protein